MKGMGKETWKIHCEPKSRSNPEPKNFVLLSLITVQNSCLWFIAGKVRTKTVNMCSNIRKRTCFQFQRKYYRKIWSFTSVCVYIYIFQGNISERNRILTWEWTIVEHCENLFKITADNKGKRQNRERKKIWKLRTFLILRKQYPRTHCNI
jgi:hypothetical protein